MVFSAFIVIFRFFPGDGVARKAAGARANGRLPDENRKVRIEADYVETCAGSCLISMGRTRVLCAASVEEGVPPHKRGSGEGWVTAEYAMLPGSSPSRVDRRRARGGRSQEIQRLIGRSMRAAVDLSKMDGLTIHVDCDVIQADGGTRCAAVTGGWTALARAANALLAAGRIGESPVREAVAAVSVGVVDGAALLDLDYAEDARAEVDMNVVMTGGGRFVEVQGTAEGAPFRGSDLNRLLALARKGVGELLEVQAAGVGAK